MVRKKRKKNVPIKFIIGVVIIVTTFFSGVYFEKYDLITKSGSSNVEIQVEEVIGCICTIAFYKSIVDINVS